MRHAATTVIGMRKVVLCWGVLLVVGCGGARSGEVPSEGAQGAASGLVTSIEAEVGGDSVRFAFHVTNPGTQPRALEFSTAARYDFEVRTVSGQAVWRWSADQLFAQVVGSETLAAGESRRYRASWAPAGRTGRFVVIGRLAATNAVVEQQAEFEIPTR